VTSANKKTEVTKDIALANYFNGNEGIEQFVQEQKDILNKEQ